MTNWRRAEELLCPFAGRRKNESKLKMMHIKLNVNWLDPFCFHFGFVSSIEISSIGLILNLNSAIGCLPSIQVVDGCVPISSTVSQINRWNCINHFDLNFLLLSIWNKIRCDIERFIPMHKIHYKRLVKFTATLNILWKRNGNGIILIIIISDAARMTDCVLRLSIFGEYTVVVCLIFERRLTLLSGYTMGYRRRSLTYIPIFAFISNHINPTHK